LDQQAKKVAATETDEVRRRTQRTRNLAAGLIAESEALIAEMQDWTEFQQLSGGRAELQAFLATLNAAWSKVASLLAPARRSGGQRVPWALFVSKLDTHLNGVLAPDHIKVTPGSPEIAFILSAVDAVFGPFDGKADSEDRSDALAKLITRQRKRKK